MANFRFFIRYRLQIAGLAIGTLIAALLVLWMQPRWAIDRLAPLICPGAIFYLPTEQPIVALTIDDGPDDQRAGDTNTTGKILQVLAQHDAKATFFMISSRLSAQNQAFITQMVRQGHELGNHLTIDVPSISLPLPEFQTALQTAEQDILAAANHKTSLEWMRPGSGRCTPEMAEIAQQQGYKIALGAPWPYDTNLPSSDFAAQQILANVQPGSIIVLHDYGPEGAWGLRTVQTLNQILPQLKQKGYRVVTLTELYREASKSNSL
ncbi:polysaccharide deacetylase family protein [Acaryochloris marina]|uniref:polysaccharide deacetylase family protein n=1 Tax=Acaryochloris marina TaxID=155978 RepID=UPI001BAF5FC8|nr:polysaccharide deacetylase family protein [Acaryochloris marina]QUY44596.1 polysaccharide deacetylase family protein [Acaryochloris marina S15]